MSEEIYDLRPNEHPYINTPTILGMRGLRPHPRNIAVQLLVWLIPADIGGLHNLQCYTTAVFPENTSVTNDAIARLIVATFPNTYPREEEIRFDNSEEDRIRIFARWYPELDAPPSAASARPT